MKSIESTITGPEYLTLGVLYVLFLDQVMHGITYTALASAMMVVFLTVTLVLRRAADQVALNLGPPSTGRAWITHTCPCPVAACTGNGGRS